MSFEVRVICLYLCLFDVEAAGIMKETLATLMCFIVIHHAFTHGEHKIGGRGIEIVTDQGSLGIFHGRLWVYYFVYMFQYD